MRRRIETIRFVAGVDGTMTGEGFGGRHWRVSRVLTGWQLEFTDPGDLFPTNAGISRTRDGAIAEAHR
jgi:hypothetical protein